MSAPYIWRKLKDNQREQLLSWRKLRQRPWHSPPHPPNFDRCFFHLTAACYEHAPVIGGTPERIEGFSNQWLELLSSHGTVRAWCVLPNHYHALIETQNLLKTLHELGRFHGRLAYAWNLEDSTRGRKVFFGVSDRAIRSDRHYWATVNYVHNNPVHHGYAEQWQDWPWSSAAEFIGQHGRERTEEIWRAYPVRDYGAGWDDAKL
jgi:putative transposase